jgi:PAS domain S-box-containing protein
MRLVSGRTLRKAIHELHAARRAGRYTSLERAGLLQAFVSLCNTMAYAHSRRVIHRDLKPDNVRLGEFGEVIVIDWGLAKWLGGAEKTEGEEDSRLTMPGQFVGTPNYVSPEQAVGDLDLVDNRSDVYSLGAILYEILTGRPPFVAGSLPELLRQVQTQEPPPIRLLFPDCPAGLASICERAMSKKPQDRFPDARELAGAVQQWQESERLAAEARYRTLIEAVPQMVWVSDPEGQITYANQKVGEVLGLKRELTKLHGDEWEELVHPDDAPVRTAAILKAKETGEPYHSEHRLRMPDGSWRWHLARAVPLRDGDGKVVQWFGSSTDVDDLKRAVTERDEALARLVEQEEEYRRILDVIPHIVWTSDVDGGNAFLNRRWFEYTGLSAEESVGGDRWLKVLHPEDVARTMRVWSACMATAQPFEIEYRLKGRDGTYRWFHGRGVPLHDEEGHVVRWFGTCTDVEDRMQSQACPLPE